MIKPQGNANSTTSTGSKPLEKALMGPYAPKAPGAMLGPRLPSVAGTDTLAGPTGFYRGAPIGELANEAACWMPGSKIDSGTETNQKITKIYTQLDEGMTTYLGEPRLTNWTTFGKFASANAGVQIARLEALESTVGKKGVRSAMALVAEGLSNPKEALASAKALNQVDLPGRSFMDKARLLRRALVNGNIAIINDIAPAFDKFLRAESAGKDGVAALRAAGFGREPLDRHGLILKAFEKYAEARKIADEIKRTYTPEELKAFERVFRHDQVTIDPVHGEQRATTIENPELKEKFAAFEKLVNKRKNLVLKANLMLGFHEQLVSLQSPLVFEDKDVAKLMEAMSRGMVFEDARGKTPLLPNGGNWADFMTRMGLKEIPLDKDMTLYDNNYSSSDMVIELRDPNGQLRRYFTSGMCELGNIARFMAQAQEAFDEQSERMLKAKPKPLPWLYKVSQ